MKLPLLLTQYLYKNKKIDLPGIGSFTLDPNVVIPDSQDKETHEIVQGITFHTKPVYKADDDLIDFIRVNTGKIKPLAEADLESFLTLGIQLLNIGKPFYLDGIGAITKSQEGGYEFVAGQYAFIKDDADHEKRDKPDRKRSVFEEQHDEYQPKNNPWRKVLLVIVVLCGLALIGWGGYSLYKKNTYLDTAGEQKQTASDMIAVKPVADTTGKSAVQQTDSVAASPKLPVTTSRQAGKDSFLYKFIVLATDKKYRAIKRYDQLLSYQLNIKMETKDSSFFKLYFAIPAAPHDTLRIKDSLNRVYATRVSIEK